MNKCIECNKEFEITEFTRMIGNNQWCSNYCKRETINNRIRVRMGL